MFYYQLGKKARKDDRRTLKLKTVLNNITLPTLQPIYDVDINCLKYNVGTQMFGNDTWGDCVIVGRANQTLRFEYYQQGLVIPITTNDCLNEYWEEEEESGDEAVCKLSNLISGKGWNSHPDNGLVMLDSLKKWRNSGWNIAGRNYTIYAFASINVPKADELKYAITLLMGAYIGIQVPQSAITQFHNNQTWTVVNSPIVGGHCIYIVGYNDAGPVCITWGRKQQMTWEFYYKYTDEAYAIVDNKDLWLANDPLDVNLLDNYLSIITKL